MTLWKGIRSRKIPTIIRPAWSWPRFVGRVIITRQQQQQRPNLPVKGNSIHNQPLIGGKLIIIHPVSIGAPWTYESLPDDAVMVEVEAYHS